MSEEDTWTYNSDYRQNRTERNVQKADPSGLDGLNVTNILIGFGAFAGVVIFIILIAWGVYTLFITYIKSKGKSKLLESQTNR